MKAAGKGSAPKRHSVLKIPMSTEDCVITNERLVPPGIRTVVVRVKIVHIWL